MEEIQPQAGLRAVLVGCGAIARTQAKAFLDEGVTFETLVDPIPGRAEALAKELGIKADVAPDLSARALAHAQLAIVCSPPWEHARQCTELLEAGIDVLCEKPLALTESDVRTVIETAERTKRVLGVAMVRRFLGQSETLKEVVASRLLGAPQTVRVRESMFGWPLSKGMLDPAGKPVGTLADSAPHALDLIQWIFGPMTLESYEDNADAGVESYCHLVLRAGEATVDIVLMRRVAVAPRWTVEFERGRAVFSPKTPGQLEVHSAGLSEPLRTNRTQDHFRLQAHNFIAAVRGHGQLRASLLDCAALARLIDACYAPRLAAGRRARPAFPSPTTLVSGGTGNIGNRLAEILAERGELGRYKFLIRNFDNAADLCRLGANLVVGDLRTAEGLDSALAGCTKILHLGAGAEPGRETHNLAVAGRKVGISRFVHFSTANVYGMDLDSAIERLQEGSPLRATGDTYCDGKSDAERTLQKFRDLNPAILRPHIVYGPGMRWSFDLANQLEEGRLAVLEPEGIANLIFVDDLVDCALGMLEVSAGGAYFVTDNAPLPWSRYLESYAQRLGHPVPPRGKGRSRPARGFVNALVASGRAMRRVAGSDSFREFVTQDPLAKATLFRFYLRTRNVPLVRKAKESVQSARSLDSAAGASEQWLILQTSRARLSSEKLLAATGFKATWSFERGLEASIQWLRARGY